VTVRFNYLAAGAENLLIGGSPITVPEMNPHDWIIEDNIMHKPLRWRADGLNRQVKNLFELKNVRRATVRRNLMVNNWPAAQNGMGALITYATNGTCPACGGIEDVVFEDNVILNSFGGLAIQPYAYAADTFTTKKILRLTIRNNYVQTYGTGSIRSVQIQNVWDRHDIRLERNTFINANTTILQGGYGYVWKNDIAREPGGPMKGLWVIDNVWTQFGAYGITAPDGFHWGTGLSTFVNEDLQFSGNVIGDVPATHLTRLNTLKAAGADNVSMTSADIRAKLPVDACGEVVTGKGADCSRLYLVFALKAYLPEP
jgi:hypothetical protein